MVYFLGQIWPIVLKGLTKLQLTDKVVGCLSHRRNPQHHADHQKVADEPDHKNLAEFSHSHLIFFIHFHVKGKSFPRNAPVFSENSPKESQIPPCSSIPVIFNLLIKFADGTQCEFNSLS